MEEEEEEEEEDDDFPYLNESYLAAKNKNKKFS
jgi:hypothetical protein